MAFESSPDAIAAVLERVADLEQSVFGKLDSIRSTSFRQAAFAPPPVHRQLANPAPLGLLGFAVASTVSGVLKLSPDNSAFFDGVFAATSFFIGGMAQIIAACFLIVLNHAHAATAFGIYGFHWATTGFIFFFRSLTDPTFRSTPRPAASVVYNLAFVAVTVVLWVPTFRMNLVLNATFVAIALVFTLDVLTAYGFRAAEVASGLCQCCAGALGFYAALLDLVNEAWQRPILPLFPHKEHKDDYKSGAGVLPYVPKRTYHKSAMSSIHL